ncbi:sulfatase [Marinoscillum sp. MHG1-6]|uniref:sulfatase n=1 Tax=Marinoscillum sp. MHG1-6 TaxID=2959627 RepID=UPI0021578471|nr:sulfatase [Marinoscillum sp. MHG1-6]
MMIKMPSSFFLVFALSSLLVSCQKQATERLPNVVLIVIDDLGWKDIGIYGSDFYQTPNVDALAREGVMFTNGYSACTVCSPTRAAIMTGKYPATIRCTDWIEGWKMKNKPLKVPDWTMYMDTSEFTLARAFKGAGYQTAHIGKWHLGEDSIYWPENQGFDINIGGWSKGSPNTKKGKFNGYFAPFGNPRLEDKPGDEYLTERLTDEAVGFIKNASSSTDGKPFFLNFWTYNVHAPLQAKEEKVAKYDSLQDTSFQQQNPIYAAMVEHMDEAVGRIIQTLKEEGLYDNTIIVFTSDNGGLIGRGKNKVTNNSPLRSGKGDLYEGGVRIPLIIRDPFSGAYGQVSETPTISMDLYLTLAKLSGISIPEKIESQLEGIDLSPVLTGHPTKERDLFWHYPHYHKEGATPYSAIRSGDWKLVYYYETESSALFNLKNDIGETEDVSDANEDVKSLLISKLEKWKDDINAQSPVPNPDYKEELESVSNSDEP